jgi:hypothetical protein
MTHNPNTTLIKVKKEEEPAVQKICRLMDIHVRYYTENEIIVAAIYSKEKGTKKRMRRLINVEMENIKASNLKIAL